MYTANIVVEIVQVTIADQYPQREQKWKVSIFGQIENESGHRL